MYDGSGGSQSGDTELFLFLSVGGQVNNATARVMTNKKLVSPYANGEGLSALPYGKVHTDKRKYLMIKYALTYTVRVAEDQIHTKVTQQIKQYAEGVRWFLLLKSYNNIR